MAGNTLVANDCKELIEADVMDARSDEDQKSLCGNSCYDALNAKYKIMLDNDCYASDDADEEASGKLQGAAYQIACQTNVDGKYCSTSAQNVVLLGHVSAVLTRFFYASSNARRAGKGSRNVLFAL